MQEPMFLLVEYIPYGDHLHYLRQRRGKVQSSTYLLTEDILNSLNQPFLKVVLIYTLCGNSMELLRKIQNGLIIWSS